jgi:hypothetical protein
MFQYYRQSVPDLANWSYIDITLEAYDKIEYMLTELKDKYLKEHIRAFSILLKCRLIIIALAHTLENTASENVFINRLRYIYIYMINKLEKNDIENIDLLIRIIQILRRTITKLKINELKDDSNRHNIVMESIIVEA